jgi:hypothetical protein
VAKMPAYHQAFMREAKAMWPTYECPCGAPGCKPTVEDLARDLWVQSRVGERPTVTAGLFSVPPSSVRAAKDAEPTVSGTCRGCGSRMELAEYLVAFLALRKAPWPECDGCTRMVEH